MSVFHAVFIHSFFPFRFFFLLFSAFTILIPFGGFLLRFEDRWKHISTQRLQFVFQQLNSLTQYSHSYKHKIGTTNDKLYFSYTKHTLIRFIIPFILFYMKNTKDLTFQLLNRNTNRFKYLHIFTFASGCFRKFSVWAAFFINFLSFCPFQFLWICMCARWKVFPKSQKEQKHFKSKLKLWIANNKKKKKKKTRKTRVHSMGAIDGFV